MHLHMTETTYDTEDPVIGSILYYTHRAVGDILHRRETRALQWIAAIVTAAVQRI